MDNKKIKVLHLIHSAVPYGGNIALLNLINELQAKGVESLVVYAREGEFIDWLKEKGVQSQKIQNYSLQIYPATKTFLDIITFIPRIFLQLRNSRSVRELQTISKRFKPDMIHTNLGPIHIGYNVAQRLNIPHIWHIREYQDLDFGMHPFPSMKSFKKKVGTSHSISITNDVAKHFGVENRSCVIYDGVMSSNEKQFKPHKEKFFLFVGRIEEAKGIENLIDAFHQFSHKNKDFRLYIVGNGKDDYVKYLKKKIESYSLLNRVDFLGFRSDRYNIMANATATIVPSRSEGFGFITVEAMFNGCLVIGRKTGGTREILEKDDLGLLFRNDDELVSIMLDVANNNIETYLPMIERAQKSALDLYSKEKHGEQVYRYYLSILKEAEKYG